MFICLVVWLGGLLSISYVVSLVRYGCLPV